MKIMSYSETRANFASALDAVVDNREEVIITRAGKDPVVMVHLDDYESMKETMYLMSSEENHRRLMAAIARVEAGQVERHDVIEVDEDEDD